MLKKRILWLSLLVCVLLLSLSLSSCDQINSIIEKDFTVGTEYFDMVDVEFIEDTESAQGERMAKANYTMACATPLYEYTATFKLLSAKGEVTYQSESICEKKSIGKGSEFYVSFIAPFELVQNASTHRIEITGKSKESPTYLLGESFTVKYMYNGEELRSESVRGGKKPALPTEHLDNLIFNGWYKNEKLTIAAKDSDKIYMDTTYYAKFSLDGASATNKITTSIIKSLVSISYTERRKEGFTYSTYVKNGSGIIFHVDDSYAYVLTNFHVVDTDDSTVTYGIYDYQGTKYIGSIYKNPTTGIKALCEKYDLACMVFGLAQESLPPISMADEDINIGQGCVALGYPDNQRNAITYGFVSYITDKDSMLGINAIRHTAPVNHGCSGGPLLNSDLELVGINYAKEGSGYDFSDGYAIPISLVREFLQEYTPFY